MIRNSNSLGGWQTREKVVYLKSGKKTHHTKANRQSKQMKKLTVGDIIVVEFSFSHTTATTTSTAIVVDVAHDNKQFTCSIKDNFGGVTLHTLKWVAKTKNWKMKGCDGIRLVILD